MRNLQKRTLWVDLEVKLVGGTFTRNFLNEKFMKVQLRHLLDQFQGIFSKTCRFLIWNIVIERCLRRLTSALHHHASTGSSRGSQRDLKRILRALKLLEQVKFSLKPYKFKNRRENEVKNQFNLEYSTRNRHQINLKLDFCKIPSKPSIISKDTANPPLFYSNTKNKSN